MRYHFGGTSWGPKFSTAPGRRIFLPKIRNPHSKLKSGRKVEQTTDSSLLFTQSATEPFIKEYSHVHIVHRMANYSWSDPQNRSWILGNRNKWRTVNMKLKRVLVSDCNWKAKARGGCVLCRLGKYRLSSWALLRPDNSVVDKMHEKKKNKDIRKLNQKIHWHVRQKWTPTHSTLACVW